MASKAFRKIVLIVAPVVILLVVVPGGGYIWWNNAVPEKTCMQCHEIVPSAEAWYASAHRDIRCVECHGTALSNGIHSLKEKAGMLFQHTTRKVAHEDIRLNEMQVLETMERCSNCHQSEYARWNAGGHAINYHEVFEDSAHNAMETPYWDCLRCHGMFYDGNIKTLVRYDPEMPGGWALKNRKQANLPTIPCLACHQIHTENEPVGKMAGELVAKRNPAVHLYIRADKRYQRADRLLQIPMVNEQGDTIEVSNYPAHKLCLQCHSPNFKRIVNTEDDRTPTGVHEGISCTACHEVHSNDATNSCENCHPAINNCGLDVSQMNTTYNNPNSVNNIHFVSCEDCHSK
ncbi:MAG: cytochrome c3 family protein [Prolixibacteraceae bacterium]|nr:cytochrome c3 family protein [Prolixibacteraceae bacterium]